MKKYILLSISALAIILSSCKKDSIIEDTPQAISEKVKAGTWEIIYYFDDVDETSHFTGYDFNFGDDGTLTATSGAQNYSGTWSSFTDDSTLKLEIHFATPEYFTDISDDWHIIEHSGTHMKLEDVSGGDGSIDYLTFSKK